MADTGDGHRFYGHELLEDEAELLSGLLEKADLGDVSVLAGVLIGNGATSETIRVYTNLHLNQYFQVPRDKVLGAKRFPSGRIVVWIPGDLRVQLITSETLTGDFLRGSIQAAAGRQTGGGSGLRSLARAVGGGGTSWGGCPTDFVDPRDPTCTLISCGPSTPPPTGCSC